MNAELKEGMTDSKYVKLRPDTRALPENSVATVGDKSTLNAYWYSNVQEAPTQWAPDGTRAK